ncbi:MAG: hypothetical protein H7A33_05880 [Deltaproteobacteria bacterium]|nr:hypothetical protein [Deltaproteobacteria bacterium]
MNAPAIATTTQTSIPPFLLRLDSMPAPAQPKGRFWPCQGCAHGDQPKCRQESPLPTHSSGPVNSFYLTDEPLNPLVLPIGQTTPNTIASITADFKNYYTIQATTLAEHQPLAASPAVLKSIEQGLQFATECEDTGFKMGSFSELELGQWSLDYFHNEERKELRLTDTLTSFKNKVLAALEPYPFLQRSAHLFAVESGAGALFALGSLAGSFLANNTQLITSLAPAIATALRFFDIELSETEVEAIARGVLITGSALTAEKAVFIADGHRTVKKNHPSSKLFSSAYCKAFLAESLILVDLLLHDTSSSALSFLFTSSLDLANMSQFENIAAGLAFVIAVFIAAALEPKLESLIEKITDPESNIRSPFKNTEAWFQNELLTKLAQRIQP